MRNPKENLQKSSSSSAAEVELGDLPEWNLADLYSGPDAAEFKFDMAKAASEATRFAESYQGKLEDILRHGKGGDALAGVIKDYEAMSDVLGRVASYASLLYAADTTDPRRQKFYGDIPRDDHGDLLAASLFPLELNRLEDDAIENALATSASLRSLSALG